MRPRLLHRLVTWGRAAATHEWLALDALRGLASDAGPDAARWHLLFLRHARHVVSGARAPDTEFADYRNHVLYPADANWGGASDAAQRWYGDLVAALKAGDWPAAAWCAGVLSHYVTDPVDPFHTAQSPAGAAAHRAFTACVAALAPQLLRTAWQQPPLAIAVSDDPDWLGQLLVRTASEANGHYDAMQAHVSLARGAEALASGLDDEGRQRAGALLALASALAGAVLQRAIAEAGVTPPRVWRPIVALRACLAVPLTQLRRRRGLRAESAALRAMAAEQASTGAIDRTLPTEDRVIRDLHQAEVIATGSRAAGDAAPSRTTKAATGDGELRARLRRLGPWAGPAAAAQRNASPPGAAAAELPLDEPPRPAPKAVDQTAPLPPVSRFKGEPAASAIVSADPEPEQRAAA